MTKIYIGRDFKVKSNYVGLDKVKEGNVTPHNTASHRSLV